MWAKRAEGACLKLCSSWATLRPVSTAVELATERCTALRLGVLIGGWVVFNIVCAGDLGAVILLVGSAYSQPYCCNQSSIHKT